MKCININLLVKINNTIETENKRKQILKFNLHQALVVLE